LSSPGHALDRDTQRTMEAHLGHDFSQVRVHTDRLAAEAAGVIGANAYTSGHDIAFGAGRYAPHSQEGDRLLAHELIHVAQQVGNPAAGDPLHPSAPNDSAELVAARGADRVARGESIHIDRGAPAGLYGDWLGGLPAGVADVIGDMTDSRPDEARLDAEENLARFMGQHFEMKNHHPTTGRGLFDAAYDPGTGKLVITLKVCFQFASGDPTNAEWLAAVGAAAATFKPEDFDWQEGEADAWKAQALADVESAWSQQYVFHNTTPHWDSLPDVSVTVDVVESAADDAHFVTKINKWPKDGGVRDAVTPPDATDKQSTAHFEESSDNGITTPDISKYRTTTRSEPEYAIVDTDNPSPILFALGKSEVAGSDRADLQKFGATLARPEIPPFPITLTGRASSEGSEESNQTLSETRAREVSSILVSSGAKTQPTIVPLGEAGAAADFLWRRVEIGVGAFTSTQETVTHEFGHMFGLGDEYPNAPARKAGDPVAHSALAQKLIPGQQPIVATDNENIMSAGENILPHHYVTFLEVLGTMTKTEGQWTIGPGMGATPRGPGDFPVPSGSDKTA
jgi:outer membrane protein OmpA-like peptidoglycan-associated protein